LITPANLSGAVNQFAAKTATFLEVSNSTTTYAYDPSGARVLQTSTTSATYYPNKYYSFTSTKSGANTYATSTNYVFNGDTLLATIDQALYNAVKHVSQELTVEPGRGVKEVKIASAKSPYAQACRLRRRSGWGSSSSNMKSQQQAGRLPAFARTTLRMRI
jgi:YD repeat-containing protein